MNRFNDLLSRHAASSMLKQSRLNEFLGQHSWTVDMYKGRAGFGQDRVCSFQVIGTESEVNHTWLWSWANTASDLPPKLLEHAEQLRDLGFAEKIKEFTTPQLPLRQVDGFPIALVASGVCGASAFYRAPYEGGALFLNLVGLPLPKRAPGTVELVNTLMGVISQFPVQHRLAAKSFFEQQGFAISESGSQIVGTSAAGEITVTLDENGRIVDMATQAGSGQGAGDKKRWWKFGR